MSINLEKSEPNKKATNKKWWPITLIVAVAMLVGYLCCYLFAGMMQNGASKRTNIENFTFRHISTTDFYFEYPSFFKEVSAVDNNYKFRYQNNNELSVETRPLKYGETIKSLYESDKKSCQNVSYDRAPDNKGKWYVLNGYLPNGLMYYKKVAIRNGKVITANFTGKETDLFNTIITEHCFRRFPDYKRINQ